MLLWFNISVLFYWCTMVPRALVLLTGNVASAYICMQYTKFSAINKCKPQKRVVMEILSFNVTQKSRDGFKGVSWFVELLLGWT